MRARFRRGAGFTLLELMVVLGLAAMMVAVVGGGAQAYLDRSRYQQTVRDVSSQLRQARSISMDSGQTVVVSYQPQTRQLSVGANAALDIPESVDVRWQATAPLRQGGVSRGEPIFVFTADGGARGGQMSVLRAGRGVLFQVNWLLGTIEQSTVEGAS